MKTMLAPFVPVLNPVLTREASSAESKEDIFSVRDMVREVVFRLTVVYGFGIAIYAGSLWIVSGRADWQLSMWACIANNQMAFQGCCLLGTLFASLLTFQLVRNRYIKAKIAAGVIAIATFVASVGLALAKDISKDALRRWLGW
jgi:hypothetical protein